MNLRTTGPHDTHTHTHTHTLGRLEPRGEVTANVERSLNICEENPLRVVAMSAVGRSATLSLYRNLLRAARGFTNYNFREYALRRVREEVREARTLGGDDVLIAYQQGRQQLAMLRRQSTISGMFPQDRHAMEVPE